MVLFTLAHQTSTLPFLIAIKLKQVITFFTNVSMYPFLAQSRNPQRILGLIKNVL